VVVSEFEVDTHHAKTMEHLNLRQTCSVDEYHHSFEQLIYHIRLYDNFVSATMLTAQFLLGLKDELRFPVEMQLPDSVVKVAALAAIQEKLLDRNQKRFARSSSYKHHSVGSKTDSKPAFTPNELCKAIQLREHRRINGLCFKCGG
jgi:hypothetical protein